MKSVRIFAVLALLICLCACSNNDRTASQQAIVRVTEPAVTTATMAVTEPEKVSTGAFFSTFSIDGKAIELGGVLDLSCLPEVNSVYEVPSCAIEGTDLVHCFDQFEITAYDDGNNQIIYSVFFLTPDITTTEGLALGDSFEKVLTLYGDNYVQNGTAYVYTCDRLALNILVQNETVISIEYRWEFN